MLCVSHLQTNIPAVALHAPKIQYVSPNIALCVCRVSHISGLLRKQAQHLLAKLSSKYAFMTPPFLNVNIDCVNFLN